VGFDLKGGTYGFNVRRLHVTVLKIKEGFVCVCHWKAIIKLLPVCNVIVMNGEK
jgi:hypothetical protein